MAIYVKICGLCSADDVRAAVEAGADALGFVFWPRSPRAVTPHQVAAWLDGIRPAQDRVGVFVDTAPDIACAIAEQAGLNVLQLHGAEDVEAFRRFRGRLWQVRRLYHPPNVGMGRAPDTYVLDSGTAGQPGGTGQTLDWDAAAQFVRAADRPVILAGGLTPENVAEAIVRVQPWGVDVSSGVESAPGCKDHVRIREFVRQCREAYR